MVTPEHEAFARAVVALAREHGMDSITMTFRHALDLRNPKQNMEQVTITWAQGRHGVASRITMETRAHATIPEREEPTDA